MEPNGTSEYVYFPHDAVISLLWKFGDGATVEVGVVGNEGMVGVHALMGVSHQPNQALVQHSGICSRVPSEVVVEEFARGEMFQQLVLRYVHAFITQISQAAACNRRHSVYQRLARWLLQMDERIEVGETQLTQEFLSRMLGARRAGVNEALQRLRDEGLVQTRRGGITILDRRRLERAACECYSFMRQEFEEAVDLG